MKHFLLIMLLAGTGWAPMQAQDSTRAFRPHLVVGTGFTYIREWHTPPWQEYTWQGEIQLAFARRWAVGARALRIWSGDWMRGIHPFRMAGLHTQFSPIAQDDFRAYLEAGVYTGDYCTCGFGNPYRLPDILYWGYGLGISTPIWRNLHGQVSFQGYQNTLAVPRDIKYSFNIYSLGISWRIRVRKPKSR